MNYVKNWSTLNVYICVTSPVGLSSCFSWRLAFDCEFMHCRLDSKALCITRSSIAFFQETCLALLRKFSLATNCILHSVYKVQSWSEIGSRSIKIYRLFQFGTSIYICLIINKVLYLTSYNITNRWYVPAMILI